MNNLFYLPILKSKQGEFDALSKLNLVTKKSVVPLLEITPMEWDYSTKEKPRTIEVHLQNFCKKIIKKWPSNNTFIDTTLINDQLPEKMTCIEYIFRLLHQKNVTPIPVIQLKAKDDFLDGINKISGLYKVTEYAIRVNIVDITSLEFEANIQALMDGIKNKPSNCHLVLDLAEADFNNVDDFTDGILYTLSQFPFFKEWKSFTICGGCFPATNLIKTGENCIPRNDWKFYRLLIKKLNNETYKRNINYGDYSIVAPGYFEFDPTKMSRSANIRYTHDEVWYVVKGTALKNSPDYLQYVSQAKNIMDSSYYLGENFSEGDMYIRKCSKGEVKAGNPTVWKWVGNNHHITKVVSDLFANSPAA